MYFLNVLGAVRGLGRLWFGIPGLAHGGPQ